MGYAIVGANVFIVVSVVVARFLFWRFKWGRRKLLTRPLSTPENYRLPVGLSQEIFVVEEVLESVFSKRISYYLEIVPHGKPIVPCCNGVIGTIEKHRMFFWTPAVWVVRVREGTDIALVVAHELARHLYPILAWGTDGDKKHKDERTLEFNNMADNAVKALRRGSVDL